MLRGRHMQTIGRPGEHYLLLYDLTVLEASIKDSEAASVPTMSRAVLPTMVAAALARSARRRCIGFRVWREWRH